MPLRLSFLLLVPILAQADLLFLIAGQSNAVGQGSVAQREACPPKTAYEYDVARDSAVPLADPAGQPWRLLVAANADGGSVAPAFVKTGYQLLAAQPTVLDDTTGNAAVRKAQDAMASERDRIHIAYSGTHQFGMKRPSWMKDFLHYNQVGLNEIGDSAAVADSKGRGADGRTRFAD